ncbi:cell division inhibitor SulA [Pontibacter sp. JAM-7]|uniref:cell division inhibitor SulA n=1 Tax=Pontibacter sp. JAM-7 TaxID=3366581 RepID=UPI003AF4973C
MIAVQSTYKHPANIRVVSERKPLHSIQVTHTPQHQALAGKVTEIVVQDREPQTLAMLLPLLAQLSFDQRWFLWLAPPAGLAKPVLQNAGVDLTKVMMLSPANQHTLHNLACRALQTGTSHLVISTEQGFDTEEMAALKDAARLGQSHAIVIRYC